MQRNKIYTLYNNHAKSCGPQDFWGQVKRSINGQVVDQRHIDMIDSAIFDGLAIVPEDHVLDLCCGNGILTNMVFERCCGGTGVDFSEFLIDIAQKHFATPERQYVLDDVESFLNARQVSSLFTKVLCYSSFQYFAPATARAVLMALREQFDKVERIYLGNLPDRSRIHNFYFRNSYVPGIEHDHESSIGFWRTQSEFAELARETGWTATFSIMPSDFYAAHYRYDAMLVPT